MSSIGGSLVRRRFGDPPSSLERIRGARHQINAALAFGSRAIDLALRRREPDLALTYTRAVGYGLPPHKPTFKNQRHLLPSKLPSGNIPPNVPVPFHTDATLSLIHI